MAEMRVGAVILAAGLSNRMGDFKPLLSIGPRTLLGHTINLFQICGIADIVVVKGHKSQELQQELDRYHCPSVFHEQFAHGMFSSVQAGVKALDPANKAFFLLPVDIPLVQPSTVSTLLNALNQAPSALVFYPVYRSRRGHPPLIRSDLVDEILSFDDQGGLQVLLKKHHRHARNVPVNDPFILLDADTPDDLDFLREHH
jgi:molybdenum cofactor cytidylyltransferase